MGRRSKDEAAQTRQAILEAAITVFCRKGVARTTLQEIAAEAGHTRGAIYHHFSNKAEVLTQLLESVAMPTDVIEEFFKSNAREDPLEALRLWSTQAIARLMKDERAKRIHSILYHRCEYVEEMNPVYEMHRDKLKHMCCIMTRQFENARTQRLLRPDITPEQAAYAFQSLCLGIYTNSFREPWTGKIEVPYNAAIDAFIQGLRSKSKSTT